MTSAPEEQDYARLRQLIMGFRITQLIYVAARLGLADRLADQPATADELAERTDAEPLALYRILRALASIGLFRETSDGTFTLTPTGHLLRSDVPGSMRNVALLYGEDWVWQAYGQMLYSARTGKAAFPQVHGATFYDFLERHPSAAAVFQGAMSSFSDQEGSAILRAYDFTDAETIVDVGAGHGVLLAAILNAYPNLSGIAFDSPAHTVAAEHLFAGSGVQNRATFVGGDFFRELPANHDLYLLKSVLHNWGDDDAVRILTVCRRAISAQGRLLVIERVVPAVNEPSEAALFDINMLVTLDGRERTEREYAALLASAGFTFSRAIATSTPLTILEALPAGAAGTAQTPHD